MPQYIGNLPLTGANDTFSTASGGLQGILIGNESGFTVIIAMDGTSYSKSLYPGTVDFFEVTNGYSGTIKVTTQANLNNIASWPSSFLQFDAVGINDKVNLSAYPLTLPRLTNVGNTVQTVGGIANSVQNDGNPLSTPILEATVSGQITPTVKLSNDGQLVLGNGNIGGTVAVHQYEALNSGVIRPILDINDGTLATEIISATEIDAVINSAIISKITSAGLELVLGALNIDATTPVAGTLAGTMTISFPLWGAGIKLMLVTLAGFNSTVKTITLPSTFTRGFIFVGDLGGGTPDLQAMVSGGNVSTTAITAFGSSANGTLVGGVAHMFQGAIHNIVSTIDSFQFTPGGVSNGSIIMIGR